MPIDDKTTRPCSDSRQINGSDACFSEDHIAATRRRPSCGIAPERADDEIGQTVAIHITRITDAPAAVITCTLAVDDKPVHTQSYRRKLNLLGNLAVDRRAHQQLRRRRAVVEDGVAVDAIAGRAGVGPDTVAHGQAVGGRAVDHQLVALHR